MTAVLHDWLAKSLRDDPGRPLITFYDDQTGERVELSLKTFDNWVSKVANLFNDELACEPGDGVAVSLPTHWLSPAVLIGAWTAGLELRDSRSARVRVVGPQELERLAREPASEWTVACSLRPLGGRFVDPLPAGWLDFAVEVPPQPDVVMAPQPVRVDGPAVDLDGSRLTHSELARAGSERATELGLLPGGRLATDANPCRPDGLLTALAAPLACAASVVLVVNATTERRQEIAEQERVTCTAWTT